MFKSTFCRIQDFIFYDKNLAPLPDPGYGWKINHNATALPPNMKPWTGETELAREACEDMNPTTVHQVIPDGPEASFIGLAYNDVAAYCKAAEVLRTTRSIATVLAGLWEYAQRHPDVELGATA